VTRCLAPVAWPSVRECHLTRRRICMWVELLLPLVP
jgi:hypothetical protein